MKKTISNEIKNFLKPFFIDLDLDKIILIDGISFGRLILKLFNASAITFGKRIYFSKPLNQNDTSTIFLIAHELVHVEQYKKNGVILFLLKYLRELIRNLIIHRSFITAYKNISFEEDAYSRGNKIFDAIVNYGKY